MVFVIKKKFIYFLLVIILMIVLGGILKAPVQKIIYPLKHEEYIHKYSSEYDIEPYLVMGIISAESRFDENAVSHKDAIGLMQLKEETAMWCIEKFNIDLANSNLYAPDVNINIGCAYLSFLLDYFDGEIKTAVAAYNAGQGNVSKWLKDKKYSSDGKTLDNIPFKETSDYVEKVFKRKNIYKRLY